ncbi:MAG TPA: metallophosphoesterase [Kofleriaceae bacterium]|nr:metallophosphoesterase [Kofleriaceae bacterium]
MRLVAHISDAHFGAHDATIASHLLEELNAQCDLVVISGDLTQRGRVEQFEAARMWLDQLERLYLVVPGNHDVPLYDVVTRFLAPRDRYLQFIHDDLEPCYADDEVAICGIDTTKTFTIRHGRVTHEQIARVAERLAEYPRQWKVMVAHHPFFVPAGFERERVEGAEASLPILEAAGIDLILTGHLHVQTIAGRNERHTIVSAQAGTCMSTRLRGEAQSYNQLRFDRDQLTITQRIWDGGRFIDGASKCYLRNGYGEHIVKVNEKPAPAGFPAH